MRAVEASAKTREQAIQNALKELGVEMHEVDNIEILDEGSRGLFGIGARPVRVRIVVEGMPEEAPRRPQSAARKSGDRSARGGRDRTKSAGQDRPKSAGQDRTKSVSQDRSKSTGQDRTKAKEKSPRNPRTRRDEGGRPARRQDRAETMPAKGAAAPAAEAGSRLAAELEAIAPPDVVGNTAHHVEAAEISEEAALPSISEAQGKETAALLQEIIGKMGIQAEVEFVRAEDDTARLNVHSEDGAILIGRKGRNLNAMQYLINRIVSRADTAETTERLVVDVEGYVDRRRTALEALARDLARKAKSARRNMRLKPMTPQERRIIHIALQEDPDVRTFSLGESLYRSVVISPKDAKPDRGPAYAERPRGGRNRQPQRRGHTADVDAGQFGD